MLNGNLGVFPGTELEGFGLPAVINGSTHATDEVAAKAQLDLTTAYDVAAEQPVLPANDLSGTDLGGLKLAPGTYRYNAAALLTGALTLDAEGDPNAESSSRSAPADHRIGQLGPTGERCVAVQRLLAGR